VGQASAAAKSIPATIPASHAWPCRTPKAADETAHAAQVSRPTGTLSASASMQRRTRNPRKKSSSAMGTVIVEPATRKRSQAAVHGCPSCAGFRSAARSAGPAPGASAIHAANGTAPIATGTNDHRQPAIG